MSLPRTIFHRLGGFDTTFTRRGTFGNEDLDFGYRLLGEGYHIVFNPNAVSWQYYVVKPHQYLRQWYQAGQADVALVRKHPDQVAAIFPPKRVKRWINRCLWRPLLGLPLLGALLARAMRWLTLALVDCGAQGALMARLFYEVKTVEYWRGVRSAGGIPQPRPLRVLAFHAIRDLAGVPVLESYGIPPDLFRRHLDRLRRAGFQFVDANEFLRFLHGQGGLPRRPLLLTFDDGYTGMLDIVLPILEEKGIPAVMFAVSGRLGGVNQWEETTGAPPLLLLDADGLRKLAESGIEIGAHSRTHCRLTRVSDDELAEEIAGSVADLEQLGLKRPRLFAYPYGEVDPRVCLAVQEVGLQAAFTVNPGCVHRGQDVYQIPRIEILRRDVGWRFWWKIAVAGRLGLSSETGWPDRRRLYQGVGAEVRLRRFF
jgi:peptidoglycan/xylan/chitin deacetylase (PgdA/CDA1 family)